MLSGRLDAHARDRAEGFQCNILKGEGAPVYSEIESPLNDDLRTYITRKIVQSAASSFAFPIQFDPETRSPVPEIVSEFLKAPGRSFVERSRKIAEHLAAIQNRINSEGLLTVVDCVFESAPALAILKLERESGVRVDQEKVNGKLTLVIEHVGELMLTDSTKVFKAGVFGGDDAVASDHQRTNLELAAFFLSKFLGCQLVEQPSVATKRFFEASEQFFRDSIKDPKTQVRYQIALSAEMESPKKQIRPRSFADEHLLASHRAPYLEHLKIQEATAAVDKDVSLISTRIAGIQAGFASGASLFAPASAVEHGQVVIEGTEGERTRVVIEDRMTSLRGRGRGRKRKD